MYSSVLDVMCMCVFSPMQSKVDPYCFIEFYDHRTAEQAIKTMNKEYAFGKVSALEQVLCMTVHHSCVTREHAPLTARCSLGAAMGNRQSSAAVLSVLPAATLHCSSNFLSSCSCLLQQRMTYVCHI